MEILSEFGFDLRLFIAQIVNFLILAFLFKKYLYKPLLNAVKKREAEIKRGLENAEKAERAYISAENKKDEIINKAAREAEKLILEAKESAHVEAEEIIKKTKEEAEKIIKQSKEQGLLERRQIEKEMSQIALTASQRILEKVLADLFTKKEKEEILKRSVKKIKAI